MITEVVATQEPRLQRKKKKLEKKLDKHAAKLRKATKRHEKTYRKLDKTLEALEAFNPPKKRKVLRAVIPDETQAVNSK